MRVCNLMSSKSLFQTMSCDRSTPMSGSFTALLILSVWSLYKPSGSCTVYFLFFLWKVRKFLAYLGSVRLFPRYRDTWDSFPRDKKAAFQDHFDTCAVVFCGNIHCRAVGSVSSLIVIAICYRHSPVLSMKENNW